ncbi:MAG TPA: hypothetical protein VLI06_14980, partial [Solimonas sp.]|nr:hypothetical protein [Solimonas sp.]
MEASCQQRPYAGLHLRLLLCASILMAGMALAPVGFAAETVGEEDGFIAPPSSALASGSSPTRAYASTASPKGRAIVTRFQSFDGDPLSLQFSLPAEAARDSASEFGVSVAELDALAAACNARRDCNQAEFDRHTTRYYRDHALRLVAADGKTPRLHVDVAQVVRRNRGRVQPVALELRRLAA